MEEVVLPSLVTSAPRSYGLRQEALATLGKRALCGGALGDFLEDAVRLVAEAIELPYAGVFELLAESGAFLLLAGTGWEEGLVGRLTMAAESGSQAGYAMNCRHPVCVEDSAEDSGLKSTALFDSHGVVSGMMVVIEGRERAFGVLGAHSRRRRRFAPDEVQFLHAAALILAQAIERERQANELRDQAADLRSFLDNIPDLLSVIDPSGAVVYQNRAVRRVAGFKASQVIGKNAFEFIHPDDLPGVRDTIRESLDVPQAVHRARYRIAHSRGQWVALEGEGRSTADRQGEPRLVVVSRQERRPK